MERKSKIFSMYLAGYTMQEIADTVNVEKMSVSREIESCNNFTGLEKSYKNLANFQDSEMVSENPIHYHNLP